MTFSTAIPQILNDIFLNYGDDFVLSPTNDLLLSSGANRSNQRIVRRLVTSPIDYIWHTDYGAGLPNYIGQSLSSDNFENIKATITSQIFLENSIAQIPSPDIFLQTIQYGLFCQINYTLSPNLQLIVLTFNVGP